MAQKVEVMQDIEALSSTAQALNQSADNWNAAMIAALIFTALAAIAVVVTTFVALKRAKALAKVQELVIQAKDKQLERDLKEKDLRIAEAAGQAAAAETKAEGFRLAIATANERASQAEARAAEAKLELAKLKTPRSLSLKQQESIANALHAFAGTHFDIAVNNDVEAQGLLAPIEAALKAAGWIEIEWKGGDPVAEITYAREGFPKVGLVSVHGVIVQMHPQQVVPLGQAAQSLASALSANGVVAKAEGGVGVRNVNTEAIHILIGKKPD